MLKMEKVITVFLVLNTNGKINFKLRRLKFILVKLSYNMHTLMIRFENGNFDKIRIRL